MTNVHKCYLLLPFPSYLKGYFLVRWFNVFLIKNFTYRYKYRKVWNVIIFIFITLFVFKIFLLWIFATSTITIFKNSFININHTLHIAKSVLWYILKCVYIHETIITIIIMNKSIIPEAFVISPSQPFLAPPTMPPGNQWSAFC